MSRPADRALLRLGQEISTARRLRRLSQEDLAERIGTSVSTVRRMEDGYPGTALHTFLRALHILDRLEAVMKVMSAKNDALGMELLQEQLPRRVRAPRHSRRVTSESPSAERRQDDPDELEGF